MFSVDVEVGKFVGVAMWRTAGAEQQEHIYNHHLTFGYHARKLPVHDDVRQIADMLVGVEKNQRRSSASIHTAHTNHPQTTPNTTPLTRLA